MCPSVWPGICITLKLISPKENFSPSYAGAVTLFINDTIKLSNFRSNPRKGQYSYLLTPKGIREKSVLTYRFLERKRQEFEDLKTELEILEEEAGLLNKDLSSSEKQPVEE